MKRPSPSSTPSPPPTRPRARRTPTPCSPRTSRDTASRRRRLASLLVVRLSCAPPHRDATAEKTKANRFPGAPPPFPGMPGAPPGQFPRTFALPQLLPPQNDKANNRKQHQAAAACPQCHPSLPGPTASPCLLQAAYPSLLPQVAFPSHRQAHLADRRQTFPVCLRPPAASKVASRLVVRRLGSRPVDRLLLARIDDDRAGDIEEKY